MEQKYHVLRRVSNAENALKTLLPFSKEEVPLKDDFLDVEARFRSLPAFNDSLASVSSQKIHAESSFYVFKREECDL